jgi:hypothetical protein
MKLLTRLALAGLVALDVPDTNRPDKVKRELGRLRKLHGVPEQ